MKAKYRIYNDGEDWVLEERVWIMWWPIIYHRNREVVYSTMLRRAQGKEHFDRKGRIL